MTLSLCSRYLGLAAQVLVRQHMVLESGCPDVSRRRWMMLARPPADLACPLAAEVPASRRTLPLYRRGQSAWGLDSCLQPV